MARYIRNANNLEDIAHHNKLLCEYKARPMAVGLKITHPSREGSVMILCTDQPKDGQSKYRRIDEDELIIVNSSDMVRIAIDSIKQFAQSVLL